MRAVVSDKLKEVSLKGWKKIRIVLILTEEELESYATSSKGTDSVYDEQLRELEQSNFQNLEIILEQCEYDKII